MVVRDRGQLLLLGGLAMAIVFLAVIPLSNSLVVTESAATSETVREIDRTADRQATIERAIRTLANRTDAVNNTDAFNRSLRNYSLYRTHVSGQRSGVYVNASVNVTASGKTANSSDFEAPTPPTNQEWMVVDSSQDISEFNITVENADSTGPGPGFGPRPGASPSANSPYTLTVSNSSGDEWQLRLVNPSGGSNDIAVDVKPPDGTWNHGRCRGTFYTIDVAGGTCTTGGTFSSYTDTLAPPYTIEFNRGDRVPDSYWNLTSTGEFNDSLDTSVGTPYVDVVYNGPDVSYTRVIPIDGETQSSPSTPPSASLPDGTVFTGTGGGILQVSGDGGSRSTITTSSTATGLGPASHIDSDGTVEIPYVDSSGTIQLVTAGGSETLLADDGDLDPSDSIQTSETRLAVGTWDGSDQSVFFTDENENTIYRVAPGGSVVEVSTPTGGRGASAVVGPADIDGDDDDELVFLGSSDEVRFLNGDGSFGTTGITAGQNTGVGGGSTADYDGDGTMEIAIVDGGNNIVFADASTSESIGSSDVTGGSAPQARQSPTTAADVDDDDALELVYVANDDGEFSYLDDLDNIDGGGNLDIVDMTDASGNDIAGDTETGVT